VLLIADALLRCCRHMQAAHRNSGCSPLQGEQQQHQDENESTHVGDYSVDPRNEQLKSSAIVNFVQSHGLVGA
jgi:hypothetical protein